MDEGMAASNVRDVQLVYLPLQLRNFFNYFLDFRYGNVMKMLAEDEYTWTSHTGTLHTP